MMAMIMMETNEMCQSCLKRIPESAIKDVTFSLGYGELLRNYRLCKECARKLREIVLGFMRETSE